MNIKPLSKNVLVTEVKPAETASTGGIILDFAKSVKDTTCAKVLAVGDSVKEVSVGDVVYLDWAKGNIVKVEGKEYVMISEDNIAMVVEGE